LNYFFPLLVQSYLQSPQINIKMSNYGLLNFIDERKLNYAGLSGNPNAIQFLEQNPDKICWIYLSANPAAIHLLEQNLEKIDWTWLSKNPAAIHFLEQNPDKINWMMLSQNPAIFIEI